MSGRRFRIEGAFWTSAGVWALGWVWWAEHVAGMAPCALCFWERWPYRALAVIGVLWMLLPAARAFWRPALGLALLSAIGISFLHMGVEQHWWPSPLPECAAPHFSRGTFAQRLASMPLHPAKPCDAPNRLFAWLPVSMTTLDLIYAAVLLVLLLTRRAPGATRAR